MWFMDDPYKSFSKNTCPGKIPKYDSRVLSDPTRYYKRDTGRAILDPIFYLFR